MKINKSSILLIPFSCLSLTLLAQPSFSNKNHNLQGQLAIQGYDPVAYFTSNRAIKGESKIKTTYNQAVYYFSNENNKNTFLENPDKYIPQYGGWCAYAMGLDGSEVKVNPETFKITDGKLYLFYNFKSTNTLINWNEDEVQLKKKADQFWGKLK